MLALWWEPKPKLGQGRTGRVFYQFYQHRDIKVCRVLVYGSSVGAGVGGVGTLYALPKC